MASSQTPRKRHPPIPLPELSGAAELNRNLMFHLQAVLERDPEADLLSIIPADYRDKMAIYKPDPSKPRLRYKKLPHPYYQKQLEMHDLRALPALFEELDRATTVTIEEPLSDAVQELLDQHSTPACDTEEAAQWLVEPIKSLLRASNTLWAFSYRGAVFKCGDKIAAKVMEGGYSNIRNGYSTMKFLAENAPDVPAPRPHGMVCMGSCNITFMTYFPSSTLGAVWKTLQLEQKLSIQHQLDEILERMRRLKREDGQPPGSIHSEIVEDRRPVLTHTSDKPIKTGAEHQDWVLTADNYGTEAYIKFLRGFLPPPPTESVFSHGDFTPDNIIVDIDENDNWTVTGIIDWDHAGFYPEYHESMKATAALSSYDADDWWVFMPRCIAPTKYPVQWMVDRLWGRSATPAGYV